MRSIIVLLLALSGCVDPDEYCVLACDELHIDCTDDTTLHQRCVQSCEDENKTYEWSACVFDTLTETDGCVATVTTCGSNPGDYPG